MATGRKNSYSERYGKPGLLFIEPKQAPSEQPVIDEATRKMGVALRGAREGSAWRGFHVCSCGKMSSNVDLIIEDRFVTNSLAVHYLAHHRAEVPADELADVMTLGT